MCLYIQFTVAALLPSGFKPATLWLLPIVTLGYFGEFLKSYVVSYMILMIAKNVANQVRSILVTYSPDNHHHHLYSVESVELT